MKRYGNFFDDCDILMPSEGNYLGNLIYSSSNTDISDSLKNRVLALFRRASDRFESQFIEKLPISNGYSIDIYIFDYNGRTYYWWDLFKGDIIIKSTLEFIITSSHYGESFVTHVWWATDPNQTPLIWTDNVNRYIKDEFR